MAVTADDIKSAFPELGTVSKSRIETYITEAQMCVNESAWGDRNDLGVRYLAAHLVTVFGSDESSQGPGITESKKIGPVSVTKKFGASTDDTSLQTTKYGRHYLMLRRKVIVGRCL